MNNILIRKGQIKDANGVVQVKTLTWLTTYKGLVPDSLLDERLKTMDERTLKLVNSIKQDNNLYVADNNGRIVGTVSYGPSRNIEYPDVGEIYSLYVLKEYQGLGLGKQLFKKAIEELINKGYNSMIINVLKGNNTIKFYEKYGGKKINVREDDYNGIILKENIMYFDNIIDIVQNMI